MDEKNELNDIILNKGNSSTGNKKILLAVAALGIILIVVVMLMNTLTSSGTDNLPQAALPPETQEQTSTQVDDSFFEKVDVVKEDKEDEESVSLDAIAQKLKEENIIEETQAATQESVKANTDETKKVQTKEEVVESVAIQPQAESTNLSNAYYIQVGSFAKYEPNKKFLDSILKLGYKYKFHKVTIDSRTFNKVLVGPFNSEAEAREALAPIKKSIEAGAFLIKI
ncbi:SPOR domain-containing protein [Sulfurimonas xiamenensis]|uniref:SPOR domain-containing protein n=1 Tax=Sulfurimonas xiamenensis TaxID=2590021 RepID=A0AAJ4A3X7_9BACT|nr:SPOR domain-containing protein [Sulfurimonas xiamenensis]QFR43455.1 SPOR domain-containing protein [Sulfurimonas xiamenensis]